MAPVALAWSAAGSSAQTLAATVAAAAAVHRPAPSVHLPASSVQQPQAAAEAEAQPAGMLAVPPPPALAVLAAVPAVAAVGPLARAFDLPAMPG